MSPASARSTRELLSSELAALETRRKTSLVAARDVRVGDWSMSWNAKAETGRLAPGIPKS